MVKSVGYYSIFNDFLYKSKNSLQIVVYSVVKVPLTVLGECKVCFVPNTTVSIGSGSLSQTIQIPYTETALTWLMKSFVIFLRQHCMLCCKSFKLGIRFKKAMYVSHPVLHESSHFTLRSFAF